MTELVCPRTDPQPRTGIELENEIDDGADHVGEERGANDLADDCDPNLAVCVQKRRDVAVSHRGHRREGPEDTQKVAVTK